MNKHFDLEYIQDHFDLDWLKRCALHRSNEICRGLADGIRETGLTQQEFANLVGIDPANLSRILTGKCSPSFKMLCRLNFGLMRIINLYDEFQKTKENDNKESV